MYAEIFSKGSTVEKLDNFRSQKDSMLISDCITIRVKGKSYNINLIVEHIDVKTSFAVYDCKIVMTDLKKCFKGTFTDVLDGRPLNEVPPKEVPNISLPAYQFLLFFLISLENEVEFAESNGKELKEGDIIKLEYPITFNAQTSFDTDYEWGGNQYGDTSIFYVTSYKIKWIW